MRNIAIFCDGTWQKIGQGDPTNVVKLARAVRVLAEDGRPQLTYYDNGVGVGEGVMNRATRWIGGAFGAGLDHKILEAYLFLALNYMPGDRIFIFGFSRGAYTARSLGSWRRPVPGRSGAGRMRLGSIRRRLGHGRIDGRPLEAPLRPGLQQAVSVARHRSFKVRALGAPRRRPRRGAKAL